MSHGDTLTWSCEPPEIDVVKLLGVHKYKDMSKVRPVILKSAHRAIAQSIEFSDPRGYFTTTPIESLDEEGLDLFDGTRLNCTAFRDKLGGYDTLLSFVITLGPKLDEEVSKGFADGSDPLGPLFLDTAGWLMIEASTRSFSTYLKSEHFGGRQDLSTRMAPGYDYPIKGQSDRAPWDLLEQAKLFGTFKNKDIPIELLDSGAMIPRLSRSGIFGVSLQ